MAEILISNIDETVREKIQRVAESKGQSVEEVAKSIIESAFKSDSKEPRYGLGTQISELFRDCGFEEGEIQELRGWRMQIPEFPE